nr:hypothetical protein [Methylobacterium sp. 37f]
MRTFYAVAVVGLTLLGSMGSVSAQPYGGRDNGDRDRSSRDRGGNYGDRDYDRGRGSRDREDNDGYRDRSSRNRDDDDHGRGRRDRSEDQGFDEREYLRCNPDVRQAVEQGKMPSGAVHYRTFGRKEGRRPGC